MVGNATAKFKENLTQRQNQAFHFNEIMRENTKKIAEIIVLKQAHYLNA